MDDMLKHRAQSLKAKRDVLLIEIASTKRTKEILVALLSSRQLDHHFSTAASRTRILDHPAGFSKCYLRAFASEIRFVANG